MNPAVPGKLDALTGLRYVAALTVLLAHMGGMVPNGWFRHYTRSLSAIGMPLFFVLSGFLMAYNYSARFQTSYRRTLWSFYVARFARIYPLYIISLLIFCSLSCLFQEIRDRPNDVRKCLIYVGTMTQSWVYIPVFTDYANPRTVSLAYNPVAWSGSTEVFFYVTFPLFVLPIAWLIKRGSHALIAGLIVCIAMLIYDAAQIPLLERALRDDAAMSDFYWRCYLCPYARLGEFLLGAIVGQYFLRRTNDPRSRPHNWWLGAFAMTACIVLLLRLSHWGCSRNNTVLWLRVAINNIMLGPLCAGLIYFLASLPCMIQRMMGSGPMVLLGNASYAMYLMHPIVLSLYEPRLTGEADLTKLSIIIYDNIAMLALLHFICLGLYHYAEVPLRDRIRRMLEPRKKAKTEAGGIHARCGGRSWIASLRILR
jgi:peptidoglycan/LPS O-acetylase OafA/YrhL